MSWFWIAFTGLGPMLWTYGIWGLIIAGCCAFAFFSPVFKKTALWIALAIVIGLSAYTMGVKHEGDRQRLLHAAREAALLADLNAARRAADASVEAAPLPQREPAAPGRVRRPRSNDPLDRDNDGL